MDATVTTTWITSVIAPVALAIVGGIGVYFKWLMNRKEKQEDARMAERDKTRNEIIARIEKLENELKTSEKRREWITRLVLRCTHQDCQVREELIKKLDSTEEF